MDAIEEVEQLIIKPIGTIIYQTNVDYNDRFMQIWDEDFTELVRDGRGK